MAAPTIDRLLNLVPDHPDQVLESLREHPNLASQQDAHGYSLLHAATSYNHPQLLHALIRGYGVDPNITDEDDETALFNAETIDIAKELCALGVKQDIKNTDGQTAAEKLADEDETPEVAAFLRETAEHGTAEAAASVNAQTAGAELSATALSGTTNEEVHPPPPLPNGVKVEVGTMLEGEAGGEPDPEFRRRIEELAAREDFQTEDGQAELRRLVEDAVSGLTEEERNARAGSRRKVG